MMRQDAPDDSDDIREIRRAVARLCAQFPGTYWRKLDRESGYPTEFVEALTKAGYLSVLIPEAYGGAGLTLTAAAAVLEEIQKAGANGAACHAQMYIMGYGQDTPARDMRAYDMLIQAESGLCSVTGTPDTPVKVGVSIADVTTDMTAHAAVLEALIARSLTGQGKAIEIAMFDVLADLMSVPLLHHDYANRDTPRVGLSHAAIYPYGAYACQDGKVVAVVQSPQEWARFCADVLQRPDLTHEPRFADNPSRVANRAALDALIVPIFAARTQADMIGVLEAADLPWSRVSTVADLSQHAALRRMAGTVPGGAFRGAVSALHRDLVAGPVPELGADTHRIRTEFAP